VGIPIRPFGKSGIQISALGLGGHHLGGAKNHQEADRIVSEAIDGGVTFFDNCWEYHRGKSEVWLGGALKGKREKVFLMTKVCTHGRDKALALQMLEESLRRLQTDHLDLWQIHGVSFDNDPELFIRSNGAAEALEQAKRQGKVKFVGFTGHKSPDIHLKMLATGFPFDAVQMPLNAFDANFLSFQNKVLPELSRRGLAVLGMKPINGHGEAVQKGVITAQEARCRPYSADGRFELYKTSLKFDNPEARISHQFPLDNQQMEVKEMMQATENTGHPYPQN